MTSTWHADDALLASYAAGATDDVVSSSLEAHLLACATCRTRIGPLVPGQRLSGNWDRIVHTLDAPRIGLLERLLVRVGVGESYARLLAATPTLRLSWLTSVAIALSFTLLAAVRPATATLVFLLVAPLVPLAGVAVAFSRALDPSAEVVDATPMGGLALAFLRMVASVAPAMVMAAIAGVGVAPNGDRWWAWLVPALALSVLSLVLSPLAPIGRVAAVLGATWALAVILTEAAARGSLRALQAGGPPESALFQVSGQLLVALSAALAALAFITLARPQAALGRNP